jgi:hypothetical protein
VSRRHIYDRMKDEAGAVVDEAEAEGSLGEVIASVNAYLRALRERQAHVGIAIGDGPHLCATCATRWPCKLSPHR